MKSFFINSFPIKRFTVAGDSMIPTLHDGQKVLTFPYIFISPNKNDIVVCKKNDRYIVKRIKYIKGTNYFIEGDNTQKSTDSNAFGMINKNDIIGKVFYIY